MVSISHLHVYSVSLCVLVAQSCLTLWDPMDCNPPGSSVHEISKQYWSGLPFPSSGDLPDTVTVQLLSRVRVFTIP